MKRYLIKGVAVYAGSKAKVENQVDAENIMGALVSIEQWARQRELESLDIELIVLLERW